MTINLFTSNVKNRNQEDKQSWYIFKTTYSSSVLPGIYIGHSNIFWISEWTNPYSKWELGGHLYQPVTAAL